MERVWFRLFFLSLDVILPFFFFLFRCIVFSIIRLHCADSPDDAATVDYFNPMNANWQAGLKGFFKALSAEAHPEFIQRYAGNGGRGLEWIGVRRV
jgi:hypothetical protein